ncbi:MAG: adenosylmethionine decarboxylase [Bacillota bacterium]
MLLADKPLGLQLLAEFWGCNREKINDPKKVEQLMLDAVKEAGAEAVGSIFHEFEPQGISGVVVISASHLAIHTWPELGYAAVDIFICGVHMDPWRALKRLEVQFEVRKIQVTEVPRGIPSADPDL